MSEWRDMIRLRDNLKPNSYELLETLVLAALLEPDAGVRDIARETIGKKLSPYAHSISVGDNSVLLRLRDPKSGITGILYVCDLPKEYANAPVRLPIKTIVF